MPSNIYNFDGTDIKMKYLEPSLSEGLNAKFDVLVPSGVYRGFRIIEGLTNLTVRLEVDSVFGDSIANIRTADNYGLSIKKLSTFTVDLSSYAGLETVITITGTYAIAANTAANITLYTTAEYDALSAVNKSLVTALGTVSVPGSGLITSANISLSRRDSAWSTIAREALLPSLVIKNSSFELSPDTSLTGHNLPNWRAEIEEGAAEWLASTVQVNSGKKSLSLTVSDFSASSVAARLHQYLNMPVYEAQYLKLNFYLNVVEASDIPGEIFIEYGDASGDVLSTSVTELPLNTVTTGFEFIDRSFIVPTNATHVKRVGIYIPYVTYAANGEVFYIDDFDIFSETIDASKLNNFQNKIDTITTSATLFYDATSNFAQVGTLLSYNETLKKLVGERPDQGESTEQIRLDWKGPLTLGANLVGSEASALISRVTVTPSTAVNVDYTLLWESKASAAKGMRWYVTPTGKLVLTQNCLWGSTTWTKDVTGSGASKIEFDNTKFTILFKNAADDTAWDDDIDSGGWSTKHVDVDSSALLTTITGQLVIGDDLLSSSEDALLPRIRTSSGVGSTIRTLVWDSGDGQTLSEARNRIYVDRFGVMELTSNCYFADSELWLPDDAAEKATKLLLNPQKIEFYIKNNPSGGFSDTEWSNTEFTFEDTQSPAINGSLTLGNELIQTEAEALRPRLNIPMSTAVGADKTLVLRTENSLIDASAVPEANIYSINTFGDVDGGLEFALNCRYDGSNWTATNTTFDAYKIIFCATGSSTEGTLRFFKKNSTVTPWADNNWDTSANPALTINPTHNLTQYAVLPHQLTRRNLPIAWGSFSTDTPTWTSSYGFKNEFSSATNYVIIKLNHTMVNDDYAVVLTNQGTGIGIPQVFSKNTDGEITVGARDFAGAEINVNTTDFVLSVMVFGDII